MTVRIAIKNTDSFFAELEKENTWFQDGVSLTGK
jgi:hypothetical protein